MGPCLSLLEDAQETVIPQEIIPEDPYENVLFRIRRSRKELMRNLDALEKSNAESRYLMTTVTKCKSVLEILNAKQAEEGDMSVALVRHIAAQDAEQLRQATKGIGADEKKMGEVLVTRLPESITIMDEIYQKKYNMTLEKLVNSEGKSNLGWLLTGALSDFGKFLYYRVMPVARRDALIMRKCMQGMGCDDSVLLEVLSTRKNWQLKAAAELYESEFGENFVKRVESETSGMLKKNYSNWVKQLLDFERDESEKVPSHDKAEELANRLYDAGAAKTFGCDEDEFIDILTKANEPTIKAIKKAYKGLDRDLEEDVKKKMGGDLEEAVLARITPRLKYFCRRIYAACKGWGTDEEALCRILGCLDNAEVAELREVWPTIYKNEDAPFNDLRALMVSELSGDFEMAILQMLDCESPKGHWRATATYTVDAKESADEFKALVESEYATEEAVEEGKGEMNGSLKFVNVARRKTFINDDLDKAMDATLPVLAIVWDQDQAALMEGEPGDVETGDVLLKQIKEQNAKFEGLHKNNVVLIDMLRPQSVNFAHQIRFLDKLSKQFLDDNKHMMEFCAQRDADAIHEAVDGWGADKDKLISVLCSLTKRQLLRVSEIYKEEHGKTLREMIDSELVGFFGSSSHFKYFMQLLLQSYAECDAELLINAMEGWGTDESLLTELCCTRSNLELREAKEVFKKWKGKDLETWVSSETGSTFGNPTSYQKFLLRCLRGDRRECYSDPDEAQKTAAELYANGLGNDGDKNEHKLFDLLVTPSREQMAMIKASYNAQFGKDLMEVVKDEFGGDVETAILARISDKFVYYANVLNKAWKGLGTDEKATSRVFARSTKMEIKHIAKQYEIITGNNFEATIRSEVSGMYKQALLVYLYNEAPGAKDVDTEAPVDEVRAVE